MSVDLLDDLTSALRCLPGVGPKSAQRMALHLLQRDRKGATRLGESLLHAVDSVQHCMHCRLFTDVQPCRWCADPARDKSQLCVVENPADVLAVARATHYSGQFFLLMGHLSPLDGVGPKDLGLDLLEARLASGEVSELTLATNPTVEGQATARYIADMAKTLEVPTLQIARGVPLGSELEFADGGTLSVAFDKRTPI